MSRGRIDYPRTQSQEHDTIDPLGERGVVGWSVGALSPVNHNGSYQVEGDFHKERYNSKDQQADLTGRQRPEEESERAEGEFMKKRENL